MSSGLVASSSYNTSDHFDIKFLEIFIFYEQYFRDLLKVKSYFLFLLFSSGRVIGIRQNKPFYFLVS